MPNALPFPTLNTARLHLRELLPTDDQDMYRLRSDERVNRYLSRPPAASLEEARATMEKIKTGVAQGRSWYWVVTLQGDEDRMIGTVCLFNFSEEDRSIEIGYELQPEFQGQGIMNEAVSAVVQWSFEQMKFTALHAFTHADNTRSAHLLSKMGFQRAPELDVAEDTEQLAAWVRFAPLTYRTARIEDIPQIQVVRHAVRENRLSDPALVTDEDCAEYLTRRGRGWVCFAGDRLAGFSIVDLVDNNVWALFVHPDFEARGIGKRLHELMLDWFFEQTRDTLWLGTAPGTRAEIFYTRQGWTPKGAVNKGEVKFEMRFEDWEQIRTKKSG